MRKPLWRIPLVAVCSSIAFSVFRKMVEWVLDQLDYLLRGGYSGDSLLDMLTYTSIAGSLPVVILFALLGYALIVLGGWRFCRDLTVRESLLSASIVAGYILLYQIVRLAVYEACMNDLLPIGALQLVMQLRHPVAIFSTNVLNSIIHEVLWFVPYYLYSPVTKVVPFLAVGLPYVYVLFAGRSKPANGALPYGGEY